MPAFVFLRPIDLTPVRTLNAIRPEGVAIGQFDSVPIFETVLDGVGHRYNYLGAVPRDRRGNIVTLGLRPGQWIVPPGLIYERESIGRCSSCTQLNDWKDRSMTIRFLKPSTPTCRQVRAIRTFGMAARVAVMVGLLALGLNNLVPVLVFAATAIDPAVTKQFGYLSTNGNSNCSQAFLDSIAKMPAIALLRGSCCSPMNLDRYAKQLEGLKKYRKVAAIPPDPYDIPAGLAQQALANYELALSPGEQRAYSYAMAHSDQHGPCCCNCWRWHVYGGLAKYLIHNSGFTGPQITEIWNLSNGCGGNG